MIKMILDRVFWPDRSKTRFRSLHILVVLLLILSSCGSGKEQIDLKAIEYTKDPYITVNNNKPEFSEEEITASSFEQYSELDYLGRCGVAFACIGKDIMPTEERGQIGQIKPSGWQLAKYDIVDGKYLYNRCHLIGYQLAGENANEKNLITGTRYMNVDGMLPFENMVADYVKQTDNHVLYRVTPIYYEENLLAKGVQMEALSVEDSGKGVSFNVFVFNAQPGIEIDYSDGSSRLKADISGEKASDDDSKKVLTTKDDDKSQNNGTKENKAEGKYILNTNTHKIHRPDCKSVEDIKAKNKKEYNGSKEELLANGYTECDRCKP